MSLELTTAAELSSSIPAPYAQPEASGQGAQEVPLRLVGAALRGRYRWAILLAAVFGSAAAITGWCSGKLIYRSGVQIKAAPTLQRVMFPDEEKGPMAEFDRYVETEMVLMRSQPVVEGAVDQLAKDPGWHRAHVEGNATKTDNTILQLMSDLTITRDNELITVYVQDPDPKYATMGAKAVVDTYRQYYVENNSSEDKLRLGLLQNYESGLASDLSAKNTSIANLTASYGTQNIEDLAQNQLTVVESLKSQLASLQLALAMSGATTRPDEKEALSPDRFAAEDPNLQSMLQQRDALQNQFDDLSTRYGPQHIDMQAKQAQLERENQKIADRMQKLRSNPQEIIPAANRAGGPVFQDPQQIRLQIAEVNKLLNENQAILLEYYKVKTQVASLREESDAIQKKLDDARQRKTVLDLESQVGGRISVIGEAQRPLEPFTDTRKKLAATGAAGGAFGGVMIVIMFGLFDRRLRHADEIGLRLGLNQILGMLPTLPGDLANPEQAALAAHAVHHIRTMLQIRARDRNGVPVLVVTSPAAGTGKTSLVLGLGLSFASTGSRTLLVDCDVVGGGLTARMNTILKRKIGRILVERRLINEAQLQAALGRTEPKGQLLGERLVEMGCLTKAALDEALRIQSQPNAGLFEALQGVPLDKCIVKSGLPGLWVLPLSGVDSQHASSLSPTAVGALFKEAKKHFDTILIDTGPVPGSLEASIAAAQADGVITIISRGESRRVVERCLEHLRTVGASLLGIVFNRANESDMATRGTTKRISSTLRESRPQINASAAPDQQHRADFGPVARAVASAATSSNGSRRRPTDSQGEKSK